MSTGSGFIQADSPFEALAAHFKQQAMVESQHVVVTAQASRHTDARVWSWRFGATAPDIRDDGVEPFAFDGVTRRVTPGEHRWVAHGIVLETEHGWLVQCAENEDDETLVEFALSTASMLSSS